MTSRSPATYMTKARKPAKMTTKEKGNRQKAQAARRANEAAMRQHPEHLRPDYAGKAPPKLGSRAYKKLQAEWYNKVVEAELKKPEEDRFVDIEWKENPNSPHIKQPASRGRVLTPGKQLYFAMARNYLTHNRWRSAQEKQAWTLHTNGKSYRDIQDMLLKDYKVKRSIWWIYYYVQATAKKCKQFNSEHKEGLLNPANADSFASDALLADFTMQDIDASDANDAYDLPVDAGYWESVPKKN